MPQENLESFFRYYKAEPQQMEAVQLLQSAMPDSLLKSDSAWIVKYRETPPAPEVPNLSNPLPAAGQWARWLASVSDLKHCYVPQVPQGARHQ